MTSSVALLRFKYLAWFGWLLSNSNSVMHYWWGLNSVRLLTGSSRSIEASINSVVMSVMTSSLVMEATSFIWGNIFVFLSENRLSMIVTSSQSHREQLISMLELIGAVIFCTGGLLFTFCLLFVTSEDSERCYGDEESRRFQERILIGSNTDDVTKMTHCANSPSPPGGGHFAISAIQPLVTQPARWWWRHQRFDNRSRV